ncbi:MAG: hypothetical protein R2851_14155 [Caldilineaceae bacterium]
MYCEEMDWCLRMHDVGWTILAFPAHVIHFEGRSSRQTPWTSFERLWRSCSASTPNTSTVSSPGHLQLTRLLVRLSLAVKAQACRRFAHGELDGTALGRELAAYKTVSAF